MEGKSVGNVEGGVHKARERESQRRAVSVVVLVVVVAVE